MRSAAESVHIVAAVVGFLSFSLLWLAVVWGLILRNGWATTRLRHATSYGIHQTVALIGLTLGAVHAFSQLAVPGGPVRLVDQFVPFLNPGDRLGLGFGVVALEVMTAAALSILIQRRLGYRRWRGLHVLTHLAFLLLVAHVLITGSEAGSPWVWTTVLISWLVTAGLWASTTGWAGRLLAGVRDHLGGGPPGTAVSVDVDVRTCARFGFCEQEAPEVFVLRTDGRLAYRPSVEVEQLEAVFRAVAVCPARAISVGRLPGTVLTPLDSAEPGPSAGAGATVTGLHRRRGGRR